MLNDLCKSSLGPFHMKIREILVVHMMYESPLHLIHKSQLLTLGIDRRRPFS